MRHLIGQTVAVLGDTLHVLLLEHARRESGQEVGVPASMVIARPDLPGAPSIVVGPPGSFVEIALPVGSVLGMVITASVQDPHPTPAGHLNGSGKRILEVLVIGTLSLERGFQRGQELTPQDIHLELGFWHLLPEVAHVVGVEELDQLVKRPKFR